MFYLDRTTRFEHFEWCERSCCIHGLLSRRMICIRLILFGIMKRLFARSHRMNILEKSCSDDVSMQQRDCPSSSRNTMKPNTLWMFSFRGHRWLRCWKTIRFARKGDQISTSESLTDFCLKCLRANNAIPEIAGHRQFVARAFDGPTESKARKCTNQWRARLDEEKAVSALHSMLTMDSKDSHGWPAVWLRSYSDESFWSNETLPSASLVSFLLQRRERNFRHRFEPFDRCSLSLNWQGLITWSFAWLRSWFLLGTFLLHWHHLFIIN